MSLSTDAKTRKDMPIARGVLDYFPDALGEVANLSRIGNDQHNPGQPMHWAKEKSTDHADCIIRHLIDRGTVDSDGVRHSAKVAWRALALLQIELDQAATDTNEHLFTQALEPVPTNTPRAAFVTYEEGGVWVPIGTADYSRIWFALKYTDGSIYDCILGKFR